MAHAISLHAHVTACARDNRQVNGTENEGKKKDTAQRTNEGRKTEKQNEEDRRPAASVAHAIVAYTLTNGRGLPR